MWCIDNLEKTIAAKLPQQVERNELIDFYLDNFSSSNFSMFRFFSVKDLINAAKRAGKEVKTSNLKYIARITDISRIADMEKGNKVSLDMQTEQVVRDYESGMTIEEMERKYIWSPKTINKFLKNNGVKMRPPGRKSKKKECV